MKQGVVLFAHNNSDVDYVEIAKFSKSRIEKYLGLPVSLITDEQSLTDDLQKTFDQVIVTEAGGKSFKLFHDGIDTHKKLNWKNQSRYSVYDLTPYDETLVLDVDYVISSDTLSHCWNQKKDFLIYKSSYDLSGWRQDKEFQYLSDYSIPFYWATAFWFKKTPQVRVFFDLLEHIKSNWHYYKILYQLHATNFRNDYAFSIALHTMNGFTEGDFAGSLPGKMFYTLDIDFLTEIDDNSLVFLVQKENATKDYIAIKSQGLDVHVMNKFSLIRAFNNV